LAGILLLLTNGILASKCPFQQSRSQAVVVSKARQTPGQAIGERDKDKENQIAKSFETIRSDEKLPQLTRSKHRDSLEQQVCTGALAGVVPKNNLGDRSAIFESSKPESTSTELKQVA
jgi:hypothetical protein